MATLIENILRRVKEAKYVRYIGGVLLDDKDQPIAISGGPGGGEPGLSAYVLVRYASDSTGTGYTANPAGMSHWAIVTSDQPIVDEVQTFAGLWYERGGTPGNSIMVSTVDPVDADGFPGWLFLNKTTGILFGPKTSEVTGAWGTGTSLKGANGAPGDKGGLIYKRGLSLVVDDPGFGWMRFDIDTLDKDDTGFWSISKRTIRGQLALDFQKSWEIGSMVTIQGNESTNTAEFVTLEITSKEEMDLGLWMKFGFKVIQGGTLTGFAEFSVMYQSVFGLQAVLNNNVARFDSLGNLIDKNGVKQSGIEAGTQATLLAKNMSDFNRQYFLVNSGVSSGVRGAGVRFRGNGTEAVADGMQTLFNEAVKFKAIFPDTQATAIANNGSSKVRITANTHLLTAGEAVDATEPVQVYISAWTGTGVAGWYKILAVPDANNYDIDLAYAAGLGTPTVALKSTQVVAPFSVDIGKLNNNTEIRIKLKGQFTASANAKNIFTRLNATEFSQLNQNVAGNIGSTYEYGFFNDGAKNKQEVLLDKVSGSATGSTANATLTMTEDTSADSTLFFRVSAVIANQVVGIRRVTVIREH